MNTIISWTQNMAVCLVIVMLIELILPKGKIQKYIKIVISLYIMFNIISPFLKNSNNIKFDNNIIYDNYGENKILEKMNIPSDNINQNEYDKKSKKIEELNEENIRKIYIQNLEKEIKNTINNYEYEVKEISLKIANNDSYKIEKLEAKVLYKEDDDNMEDINNINEINKIEINIKQSKNENEKKYINERELTDQEKNILISYLSKDYNISKNNIVIY